MFSIKSVLSDFPILNLGTYLSQFEFIASESMVRSSMARSMWVMGNSKAYRICFSRRHQRIECATGWTVTTKFQNALSCARQISTNSSTILFLHSLR